MQIGRPLAIVTCALALSGGSCNQRDAVLDTPVSPSAPAPAPPGAASVSISPSVVDTGGSVRGTILLTGPAAGDGVDVSLSASDDAAIVDPVVRIPGGQNRAEFGIATRMVPNDREVVITASTADRSVMARFRVWAEVPFFFRWTSEPGDSIGSGGADRFTPPTSTFSATCDRNTVNIQVTVPGPAFWSASFGGPGSAPLRPGTYEAATSLGNSPQPYLRVGGRGRGCGSTGRFVIHDIDLQNDRVNRFHASFTQRCESNGPGAQLTGEVRLANMPPSSSIVSCQR